MSNYNSVYRRYFDYLDSVKPKMNNKFTIELVTKRICEGSWHKDIELEKFQECPICKSVSCHTVVVLKRTKKEVKQ